MPSPPAGGGEDQGSAAHAAAQTVAATGGTDEIPQLKASTKSEVADQTGVFQ